MFDGFDQNDNWMLGMPKRINKRIRNDMYRTMTTVYHLVIWIGYIVSGGHDRKFIVPRPFLTVDPS